MKKLLILLLPFLVLFAGCSEDEAEKAKDEVDQPTEDTDQEFNIKDVNSDEVIATLDEKKLTGEDLKYEMQRLKLIYFLQGDQEQAENVSYNVALQEWVKNEVIHQIAQEEGIKVDPEQQAERARAVREDIEKNEGYSEVMEGIDEEWFWEKEEHRYKMILEAEKLLQQMSAKLKEDHPDYSEQALRYDAQEDLDLWIQEKLADMEFDLKIENS